MRSVLHQSHESIQSPRALSVIYGSPFPLLRKGFRSGFNLFTTKRKMQRNSDFCHRFENWIQLILAKTTVRDLASAFFTQLELIIQDCSYSMMSMDSWIMIAVFDSRCNAYVFQTKEAILTFLFVQTSEHLLDPKHRV